MRTPDERWDEQRLTADMRPRKKYVYFVTGRMAFPFDMLRHDRCWPSRGEDAAKLDYNGLTEHRSIKLESYNEPTVARWSSFGWSVGFRAAEIVGRMVG